MTEIALDGVFHGALTAASLSASAGLHVVLAAPADGAAELASVIGGLVVPRRGSVRVGGADPARSPETRARIGLVLLDEPAFFARTTVEAVRQVLELRGQKQDPGALLSDHGLGSVAHIRPARLDRRMRRRVAWALALAIKEPLALVVHEPLSLGSEGIARELSQRAEAGVTVVALTASPRDACELGDRWCFSTEVASCAGPGLRSRPSSHQARARPCACVHPHRARWPARSSGMRMSRLSSGTKPRARANSVCAVPTWADCPWRCSGMRAP